MTSNCRLLVTCTDKILMVRFNRKAGFYEKTEKLNDRKTVRTLVLLMENCNAKIELGTDICYETIMKKEWFCNLE